MNRHTSFDIEMEENYINSFLHKSLNKILD